MLRFLLLLIFSFISISAAEWKGYIHKNNLDKYRVLLQSNYPDTAPTDFNSASYMQIPSMSDLFPIELLSTDKSLENYLYPDGIFTIGKNYWRWEKPEGIQVIQYFGSHIVVKFRNHRVTEWFSRKDRRTEWIFPDNSKLTYFRHPVTESKEYIYRDKTNSEVVFRRLIQPNYWMTETFSFGSYEFHFNKPYSHYVYQLKQSELLKQLPTFLKEYFGTEFSGNVPIALFDDIYEYRKFINNFKEEPGAIGYKDMVVACCDQHKLADISIQKDLANPPEEQVYSNLMKGITEHILVRGCYNKNLQSDEYIVKRQLEFLSKAMTEFYLAENNQSYKAYLYKKYFSAIDEYKVPDINKDSGDPNYSVFSFITIQYLLKQGGEASLGKLYNTLCKEQTEEVAWKKTIGDSLESFYEAANKYYAENRNIYSIFKGINLDTFTLYEDTTKLEGYERIPQNFIPPATVLQVNHIPDFFYTYRVYLPSYNLLFKEQFKNKTNGNLYEISIGNYEIADGKFKILHKVSKETKEIYKVIWEYAGHKISNASDGILEWTFPDGSYCRTKKTTNRIQYYNRNGVELKGIEDEVLLYDGYTTEGKEKIATDKLQYSIGEKVVFTFSNLTEMHKNFVLLTKKINPDSLLEDPVTLEKDSGKVVMDTTYLSEGLYEVRLYSNWPYSGLRPSKRLDITINVGSKK